MNKIGRNDLCPCGSGKKYKRCCGKSNVISIESLLENELKDLQFDIINFSLSTYDGEISRIIQDWTEYLVIPEESLDMYHFFTLSWAISTIEINGRTILEQYIDKNTSKWPRQRMKDILHSWKDVKPTVSIVQDQDENQLLTLKDLFTNEITR